MKTTSRVRIIWTQEGLTLVELAIVILILSFILLLSIPRFSTVLVGQRLTSAGHFMTGMVRHVYDQSTAKRRLYRLNYHLTHGELWVTYLNDDGEFVEDVSNLARRRRLPAGVQFEDVVIPAEKVTEGQTYTQFFPTGFVDRSIIHLRADNGAQLSLLIHPLSGRVTLEPGYYAAEVVEAR